MVTKSFSWHFRAMNRLAKNHYETLGIKSTASQSEVKAAYYRKSMELHPDRENGSRKHFEEVTNAYQFLRGLEARKMYDTDFSPATQSGQMRKYPTYHSSHLGRTPVFNLEEWMRAHYGNGINRTLLAKRRDLAAIHKNNIKQQGNIKFGILFLILGVSLVNVVNSTAAKSNDLDQKPESG